MTGSPFSSVQSLSRVRFFGIPWTAAHQASLPITNSQNVLKLMSVESVMPSNHLILCRPLLLLPSIFPSIRVFSNESALCTRWPKDWSFSLSISPSSEYSRLISFRMDWLDHQGSPWVLYLLWTWDKCMTTCIHLLSSHRAPALPHPHTMNFTPRPWQPLIFLLSLYFSLF